MNNNKREQRCIELFDRLKVQFLRSRTLDDAQKGYIPCEDSKVFNRRISEHEASLFLSLLIRFTAYMNVDDFNTNWFFLSDYIYQDEDENAKTCVEDTLENNPKFCFSPDPESDE